MAADAPEPEVPPALPPGPDARPVTGPFLSLADRGRYLLSAVLALVILSVPLLLLIQPGGGRDVVSGAALPLLVALLAAGSLAILVAPLLADRRAGPAADDEGAA